MIGEYAELGKNSNLYLEQISLTLPGVPVGWLSTVRIPDSCVSVGGGWGDWDWVPWAYDLWSPESKDACKDLGVMLKEASLVSPHSFNMLVIMGNDCYRHV
jgi:hypothetical protein